MFTTDTELLLQILDEPGERILHPARVIGQEGGVCTAQVEKEDLPLSDGQRLLVFFHKDDRDFMQQPARIHRVLVDEPGLVVQISAVGEPVSAETRQHYRASAVLSVLSADFGAEHDCPLLDVSCTGFAVTATETHEVGSLVDAALRFEGMEYRGRVCVQSVRALDKGRTRYGVYCVESQHSAGGMPKGLQQINMFLQRKHLRRLAGV